MPYKGTNLHLTPLVISRKLSESFKYFFLSLTTTDPQTELITALAFLKALSFKEQPSWFSLSFP